MSDDSYEPTISSASVGNAIPYSNSNLILFIKDWTFFGSALATGLRDYSTCRCPRYRFVDGVAGDDSDSGFTPDHAWKTIARGLGLYSGQVLMVKAGIYNESNPLLISRNIVYGYGGLITINQKVTISGGAGLANAIIDGNSFDESIHPGLTIVNQGCARRCTIMNWKSNVGGKTNSAAIYIYSGVLIDSVVEENEGTGDAFVGYVEGGTFYYPIYTVGYIQNSSIFNNSDEVSTLIASAVEGYGGGGYILTDCIESGNIPAQTLSDFPYPFPSTWRMPTIWSDVYPP